MPKRVDRSKQRRQIALAACQAIASRGVDHATMVDIAEHAGVTTGMITHYFDSKTDIIAAALKLILERMESRMEESFKGDDDSLFTVLKETLPVDGERRAECAVWVSFWGKVSTDPKLAQVNRDLHEYAEALYAKVIRVAWTDSTTWPNSVFDTAHRSVLNFLNGLTASAITSPQSWPVDTQFQALQLHIGLIRRWADENKLHAAPEALSG